MRQQQNKSKNSLKGNSKKTSKRETGGKVKKPPVSNLENKINVRKIKIKLIAVGGGAASIINDISRRVKGIDYLLADTDQRSFRKVSGRLVKKLEFGGEKTFGWGTGMNPDIAKEAIIKERDKIAKAVKGYDLVILLSCLGGGVGSGAAPIFAELLKENKILSLGIFTLPFEFEGGKKAKIAKESIEKMKSNLSSFIVLPNEKILDYADKREPLKKSLGLINKFLIDYLEDIIYLVSKTGLINIDFADLKAVLNGKGQVCCFGRSLANKSDKAEKLIENLFKAPFFSCPPKLRKILFNIASGGDLDLKEVEKIATAVSSLNDKAKIIFGISQDKQLGKKMKLTFLGVGEEEKERPAIKEKANSKKKKKGNKENKKNKEKKTEKKPAKKERRSALEVQEEIKKEAEEEEWNESQEWEIPAFLRRDD